MKLAIVISSNDPETVWNAIRLANVSIEKGDHVRMFLLGRGVEAEGLDTDKFNVSVQMRTFVERGGEFLACGTCLKIRHKEGSDLCPLSTMADLHAIISQSDKVLTF